MVGGQQHQSAQCLTGQKGLLYARSKSVRVKIEAWEKAAADMMYTV